MPDLDECTRRLHETGRANIHFLLAARASEWLNAPGDTTAWRTRIKVQDAIVPHGISHGDAKAIIRAWERFGEAGLKQLTGRKTKDAAAMLVNKTRSEAGDGEEDSFFGALLDVRFSEAGLLAHVAQLLAPLRTMPIDHSTSTLLDALLYVAACHGAGIPGIDERVLADLIGVPRDWLYSQVVNRLGEESFAIRSAGHVFTRHRKVAEAILVEAERTLGLDVAEIWERLVKQTVLTSRNGGVSYETHAKIVHIGPRLQSALPKQLSETRRSTIAIAAAKAAVDFKTEWLGCIVDLGKTYRIVNDPPRAIQVFRDHLGEAPGKVDYERVIRGYWYEWSVCEGENVSGRELALADAWLGGLSLSDHLNPAPLTHEQIKRSCAGLGIAFGKLAVNRPNCPYAKGRRAVSHIGRLGGQDAHANYFDRYDREADAMATPHPKDLAEAIGWLVAATNQAGTELKDTFLRDLATPDSITFQHLGSVLKSTRHRS